MDSAFPIRVKLEVTLCYASFVSRDLSEVLEIKLLKGIPV